MNLEEIIKQNIINKPYRFGKNIYAEIATSGEAHKGKTIIYAHPDGNLLVMSEDTLKNKIDLAIAEREKDISKKILNLADNCCIKDSNNDDVVYSAQLIRLVGEITNSKK